MLGQSLDPNQFLGPTGVTVLALAMLFALSRAVLWLLNRLLEEKDSELKDVRQDRDQWKELALKGLTAAEKSTDIAQSVVSDDVLAELRRLQAEMAAMRRGELK